MYYRSPDIIVTSDQFIILRPHPARFRIEFLQDVYIVRHSRTGRLRSVPAQEIRARYGVHDVRLFHTTDPTTFGQVRRALIRALEHRDMARRYAAQG